MYDHNQNINTCLRGSSWPWSYGSWIYNYRLCNQCLSPLTLWVRILLRRWILDTTLCDTVCQWLEETRSINKIDCYEIVEILLKVALNTTI